MAHLEELQEAPTIRIPVPGAETGIGTIDPQKSGFEDVTNFVNMNRKNSENGIITLNPITEKQNQELQALQQRNKELEQALNEAKRRILALNTMLDMPDNDGSGSALKYE